MTLAAGSQLSQYRLIEPIGESGMGVLWRARDTALGRDVAIKVLPDAVAGDPDLMSRFEQEARLLASLNHPHIASIYGGGVAGSVPFLAMELVEGVPLAERISHGSMPVAEAVETAQQIAEALEFAHEKGVFHRDLRPANIILTEDGQAKVLDFRFDESLEREISLPGGLSMTHSPTLTTPMTAAAMDPAAVAYRSPEQVRGREVDHRADIWALGCVLYECLTGRRAFDGESSTDVLARILEKDPDWDALPARTPPRVRELLERCLEKDLKHRTRDAGDIRIELERARAAREWASSGSSRFGASGSRPWRQALPWAVFALAIAGIAALLARGYVSASTAAAPRRVRTPLSADITDPDVLRNPSFDASTVAISPDGRTFAYIGRVPGVYPAESAIFLRLADSVRAFRRIDSPSRYFALADPFFSPDGKWLGFSSYGIYKVPLSGGRPVRLVENLSAGGTKGATWTERGIVLSPAAKAGLVLVGDSGGPLQTLTVPDASKGEVSHRWPSVLPGGRRLLFTIKKEGITSFDQGEIALLDLDSGSWTTILRGGSFARYLPTGHIVFARGGAILAVPFDLGSGRVTGPPVTVLEGVMTEPGSGAAQFAVAPEAGSVLYVPGGPNIQRQEIVWVDRRGVATPSGAPLAPYDALSLSPDGTRVAATVFGATDAVVVYDFRSGSTTHVAVEGNCGLVCWHPDGRQVLLFSDVEGGGKQTLFLANADGTGKPRRIDQGVNPYTAKLLVRLPEGIGLIWSQPESDLMLTPLEGHAAARPVSGSGGVAPRRPAVSPDGRWLAYDTEVPGGHEVYVRPFPAGIGSWQISRGGGDPMWAPGGNEILYERNPDMATSVSSVRLSVTPHGISASAPTELFAIPSSMRLYGFHPDGQRLLATKTAPPQFPGERVVAILNWFDQVAARVSPPGK